MPTAQFKEGKLVPAGKGKYTLLKVEVVENKFYKPEEDGEDKKLRWEWHFVLDEDPEAVIRKWTSPNISVYQGKKSECRRLFETLLDKELTEATKDDFGNGDTDILVGKKLELHIKHEKKEGNTSAKIIDFESVTGQSF